MELSYHYREEVKYGSDFMQQSDDNESMSQKKPYHYATEPSKLSLTPHFVNKLEQELRKLTLLTELYNVQLSSNKQNICLNMPIHNG